MKKRTADACFLVSPSPSWMLGEEGHTVILHIVELEKIYYTEFHQGTEKGRNSLLRGSVMEK